VPHDRHTPKFIIIPEASLYSSNVLF